MRPGLSFISPRPRQTALNHLLFQIACFLQSVLDCTARNDHGEKWSWLVFTAGRQRCLSAGVWALYPSTKTSSKYGRLKVSFLCFFSWPFGTSCRYNIDILSRYKASGRAAKQWLVSPSSTGRAASSLIKILLCSPVDVKSNIHSPFSLDLHRLLRK